MEDTFSRDNTKAIKGIAIILMLMHHLYVFPNRLAIQLISYTSIFGQTTIEYLGTFAKICVSMFMFLGGYGAYKQLQQNKFNLFKKIKGLYIQYWKIFFIFVPIAFIFFSNQPIYCKHVEICNTYSAFSWKEFLNNFIGLSDSYNGEWGFLRSYLFAMITFPLVVKIMEKHSTVTNIWIVIIYNILVRNIFPAIGNEEALGNLNTNFFWRYLISPSEYDMFPPFWMGIIMAKDDLLVKTKNKLQELKMLNPLIDIIALGLIVFIRTSVLYNALDMIYVPAIIIFSLDILKHLNIVNKILINLGKQSTNMWLIHSFLIYYFYPCVKIILYPRNAVIVLIWLIICTYIISSLINKIYEILPKNIDKMKFLHRIKNIKMLSD